MFYFRKKLIVSLFLLKIAMPTMLFASGGAYLVDDAVIVPQGNLQIETWYRTSNTRQQEAVIAPAFSFSESFEVTLQGARYKDNRHYTTNTTLQGKYLFNTLQPNSMMPAVGIAGGVLHSTANRSSISGSYVYVPLTIQPISGMLFHGNIGWQQERRPRKNYATWGVGANFDVSPNLTILAETFGRDTGRTGFQAGFRPIVFQDSFEIDVIYGRNIDATSSNWLTIGATFLF